MTEQAINQEKYNAYKAAKVILDTTFVTEMRERLGEYIYEASTERNELAAEVERLRGELEKLDESVERVLSYEGDKSADFLLGALVGVSVNIKAALEGRRDDRSVS